MENNPQNSTTGAAQQDLISDADQYTFELIAALRASLAAFAAERARLLPEHRSYLNEGWLARTQGLPRLAPNFISPNQRPGWLAGWDKADDMPRTAWVGTKEILLAPLPVPGPPPTLADEAS